jgi:polyphosphate kinase
MTVVMVSSNLQPADAVSAEPLIEPALFFNRELSLLAFNRRVLDQAMDATTPLIERLRFLCISSSNLDECRPARTTWGRRNCSGKSAPRPARSSPNNTGY